MFLLPYALKFYILRHPMMLTLNIEISFIDLYIFLKEIIVWFITSAILRGHFFSRDGSSVCLSVSRIIRPGVPGGKVSPGMGI